MRSTCMPATSSYGPVIRVADNDNDNAGTDLVALNCLTPVRELDDGAPIAALRPAMGLSAKRSGHGFTIELMAGLTIRLC
jgi:hypothetical protein